MLDAGPRISVLVANYNGAAVIEQCLDSLMAQQIEANIEIIVHDDASTDHSAAIVAERYPGVQLIHSEHNRGFCAANNAMANIASGDYLLLLNNDAFLENDAIATLLNGAEKYPGVVLTLPQYQATTGELIDCGMAIDLFSNAVMHTTVKEQTVAMVMGACLWIPRELWDSCGGFPQPLESMAEDMYLCNCARLLGRQVVALSGSAYYHHVGHSFGGGKVAEGGLVTTRARRALSERNRTWVMAVTYPAPVVYMLLPLHLMMLLLEGGLLSLIRRDVSVFRQIYWAAIRHWINSRHNISEYRQRIQSRRAIGTGEFFAPYRVLPHKMVMLLRHGMPKLDD